MKLENNVTTNVKEPGLQHISYDPKSKKIEVVHYFNLKKGEDIVLVRIEKLVKTDKDEPIPLVNYKRPRQRMVDKFKDIHITRFIYHKVKAEIDHPHAKKFPDRGTSFPLSHLPHHIEVIVE